MTRPALRLACLMLCLLVPASSVFAQRSKSVVPELEADGVKGDMARAAQKKATERFDKADGDRNGQISRDEATATLPYVAENFEKYDKNKDGQLSWEEFIGHDKWKRDATK